MKNFSAKACFIVMLSCAALCLCVATSANAEQIKDPYHPSVNSSPITLMKDNMITQALGGRVVDLDVWVGEFIKFDDNIFNTSQNKQDDVISSTAAGFKMEAHQKDVWKLRVEGQLQHNAYADHSGYDGFEGYFHSEGSVDFSPALSGRMSVNYDNTYDNIRDVEDIYGLHQFAVGTGITVKPSPFMGIDFDCNYFGQRRDTNYLARQNYDEYSFAIRPYYDITPNTQTYIHLGGSIATPEKDIHNDSQSLSMLLGVSWKYKNDARLYAEVGYKYMHFGDNGTIKDTSACVNRPALRLGGEYALNADWKAGVRLFHTSVYGAVTSEASDSNYIDRTVGSVFLEYSPGAGRFTAKLAPYYMFNEPSEDDSYADYGTQFSVTYSVTDWFNVSAGYRYSVKDYKGEASYDRNIFTVGFAATF